MEDLESLGLRLVEYPPPHTPIESKLLMEDLENLGLRLVEFGFEAGRKPPRISTSHGGLRKFGFEPSRIPPLPHHPVWRVTTVSPQGYRLVRLSKVITKNFQQQKVLNTGGI